jgi:hypothetical protein
MIWALNPAKFPCDLGLITSAVDPNPDPDCIRIQWGPRIRFRNPDPNP